MRPALIGFGGHVTGALVEQLGAVPGLADRLELHVVPPGIAADPALLARAAVVLDEGGTLDRATLPVECAVIRLPRVSFASLWPPASAQADLDRLHAAECRDMFRREQDCDIRIAGFVLSRFRAERLFHGPEHPAAPLLAQILAQLLGHPALAATPFDAALRAVLPGLAGRFADAQAPVPPAVAVHFTLAWWTPPPRPAAPAPALMVGPPLADRPGTETLHPATEIARTPPVFATTIDPAIARHGAALLSAESARYTAPASHLATLAEAVVLGATGAVLHDGTVLSDSIPPGSAEWPSPTLSGRRIEAPCLLGIGPFWQDDPHAITGTLPRLLLYARLRRRIPDLLLLLPEATPGLEQALAILGIAEPAILRLDDAPLLCARLILAGPLDAEAISPLATAAARALTTLVPLTPPGPDRIHLTTSTVHGHLANAPEIAATLAANGFIRLDADTTPLAERIALLRGARILVAAQGPALAELAFCPPGATVLELVGPADPVPLFWSLASCAGLRYGYIVGEAVGAPAWHGGFSIPLDMLEHAVAR